MQEEKTATKEKTGLYNWIRTYYSFLIVSVALLLLFVFDVPRLSLSSDSPIWHRLVYHFFHGNVFHLLANLLALYSVSKARLSRSALLTSFVVACLVPATDNPVVGLSGFLFAVMGIVYGYHLPSPKSIQWAVVSYIVSAVPMLFTTLVAVEVHIVALTLGLFVGFVTRIVGCDYREYHS